MILTEEWFTRYGELYSTHDGEEFHFEVVSEYYVFLNHARSSTRWGALNLLYDSLSSSVWAEVCEIEEGKIP